MISRATYILLIIATYPHDVKCMVKNNKDPYHNRSETFNPAVEGVCQTGCLPQGAMSKILCFESFDYANCAYQATINRHCWPELKQKAQNVLAQLNQAGEFQRCGYSLDPSSQTGFTFDQSRSDLKLCYDFYFFYKPPTSYCIIFYACWKKEFSNPDCREIRDMLDCCAEAIESDGCRQFHGRYALIMWRKYQENGDFDRCGLGYYVHYDDVDFYRENKYHITCYNLSGEIGASFSTNGQESRTLNERFWIIMVALGIIVLA
ncbi:uncharacterized protein LOC131954119 [Physella acuta]|uniref:uncharacterized protein LOC131954119 n=1 Tax=Physella acuta TaxID=109671 RepID=UPI0027DC7604|nr:uncharacterized protein LOC131954119 [Physella acuta]